MASIRQGLSSTFRVRGHIRPRESIHTLQTMEPSSQTLLPPSLLNSPISPGIMYIPDVLDSIASADSYLTARPPSSSPAMNDAIRQSSILLDGPSRPRHIMPVALMYVRQHRKLHSAPAVPSSSVTSNIHETEAQSRNHPTAAPLVNALVTSVLVAGLGCIGLGLARQGPSTFPSEYHEVPDTIVI